MGNKAKFVQATGYLHHKKNKEFSDIWVTCRSNKNSSLKVKCFNDGTFEINGQKDIFPLSCEKIGCNTSELGLYNSKLYQKSDGCKKGYFEDVKGNKLETDGNMCYRKCAENGLRSKRKIKCVCD